MIVKNFPICQRWQETIWEFQVCSLFLFILLLSFDYIFLIIYFNFSFFKATSAPSERIFSSASDILTSDRARLAPETVQALMCLKHWYHSGIID